MVARTHNLLVMRFYAKFEINDRLIEIIFDVHEIINQPVQNRVLFGD